MGVCGRHKHIQGDFSLSNSEFASGDSPFPFRWLQMQIEMTRFITESSFNCIVCRDNLQLNSTVGNKPPNILREHSKALPPQPLKRDTLYLLTAERQSSLKQWMLFSTNCRLPGTVVCGNNASEENISNGLLFGLDFFFGR